PAVAKLFRHAYAKTEHLHHRWWEQAAVQETIRAGIAGLRVKIVPRQRFNSYSEEFRTGDFVIHYPGRPDHERTSEIRRRAAAWRSDGQTAPLRIHDGDWGNPGGRRLTAGDGAETILIPFDQIVARVTKDGRRRINLLKLDCEAAEYPILFTSKCLALIDGIC